MNVAVISETEKEMILQASEPASSAGSDPETDSLTLKYVNSNHFQVILGEDGQGLILDYKRKKR